MAKLIRRDSSKQALITSFFNGSGDDKDGSCTKSDMEPETLAYGIETCSPKDGAKLSTSACLEGIREEQDMEVDFRPTSKEGVGEKSEQKYIDDVVLVGSSGRTSDSVSRIESGHVPGQEDVGCTPTEVKSAASLDTASDSQLGRAKRKIIDDDFEEAVIDTMEVLSTNQDIVDFDIIDTKIPDIIWDTTGNDTTTNSEFASGDNNASFVVYDLDKYLYTDSTAATEMPVIQKSAQSNRDLLIEEDNTDYIKETEERTYYLNCKASKICKMFNEYIENYYLYYKTFSFPPWIQPCHIRDSSGHKPDSDEYNPSTLLLPPPTHKWVVQYRSQHYTPTMKQYWSVKSIHFDKIVLFKMGRFYELFYIDACIGNRACDLRWMGKENKPHVGFPEQSLQFYASKLVKLGFKVVVVEQMETPKEMLEKTRKVRGCDRIISREVCHIFSRGTLSHSGMLPSEAQPLAAIMFKSDRPRALGEQEYCSFALCIVDVITNSINLSFHEDNEGRQNLKTILTRTRPAEILYTPDNVPGNLIELFKRLPFKPQISVCGLNLGQYDIINKIVQENINNGSNEDFNLVGEEDRPLIIKAVILASSYLANMELGNLIKSSNIHYSNQYTNNNLKMGSWVYDHLEVFDTILGDKVNSFLHYLDNTTTPFGSRLLRKWVTYPATDILTINSRLDSVEWLLENHQVNNELRTLLRTIGDLERSLGSICNSSKEKRAVYFHNINSNRLMTFYKLLNGFDPFEAVRALLDHTTCKHLSILIAPESDGGAFPDLKPIITLFTQRFQLVEKQCFPKPGQFPRFDAVSAKINGIIDKLNKYLTTLSTFVKTELKFAHSKFRYEIECPDTLFKKLACKCEITSTRKGFVRFRTKEVTSLCNELEDAEFDRSEILYDYFKIIVGEFMAFVPQFYKAVHIVAEIDCLSTFAFNALSCGYTMSKPKLLPMDGKPVLHLEHSIHPILGMIDTSFVPNDICMNCNDEPNVCLLLTGPNMGGKSTILRQICLTVIMAQIGSFVPAKTCEMTIVDKIFTRLGASDSIMEGKSTFYVELEEISQMMYQASPYSLAMIDELGRGTSTFDGTAIALSSLVYIANRLSCRCIFSTHYHLICNEAKLFGNISMYNMSASVGEGEVKFLFKFVKGECSKSQGLYIAKLANIPSSVITLAENVGKIMENTINQKNQYSELLKRCIQLHKSGDLAKLEEFYNSNRIS